MCRRFKGQMCKNGAKVCEEFSDGCCADLPTDGLGSADAGRPVYKRHAEIAGEERAW